MRWGEWASRAVGADCDHRAGDGCRVVDAYHARSEPRRSSLSLGAVSDSHGWGSVVYQNGTRRPEDCLPSWRQSAEIEANLRRSKGDWPTNLWRARSDTS